MKLLLALVFLFYFQITQGQWKITNQEFDVITNYLLNGSSEESNEVLLDQLAYFYENPISINSCDRNELSRIPVLNNHHIDAILKRREVTGSFHSIYELQTIDGLNEDLFKVIRLMLKVDPRSIEADKSMPKSSLLIRSSRILEKQDGYKENGAFLGNRESFYLRYFLEHGKKTKLGFILEKDPGEKWFSNKNGFDFSTGFIIHQSTCGKFRVLFGDYHLKIGQGLMTWTGASVFGSELESVKRNHSGVVPYTSTNENEFFRGAVIEYRLSKKILFSPFLSRLNKDANLIFNEENSLKGFTSLKISGRHHTLSEKMEQDVLVENNIGGSIIYHSNSMKIGVSKRFQSFSLDQYREPEAAGLKRGGLSSIFYDCWQSNFNFFGEVSYDWYRNGWASINGILISLDPKLNLVFKHRFITNNYFSLYGTSERGSSKITNEESITIGFDFRPKKSMQIKGMTNFGSKSLIFERKWNYLSWIQFGIKKKKLSFYIRQTTKTNDWLAIIESSFLYRIKNNTRLNFDLQLNNWLSIRNRVEFCSVLMNNQNLEKGNLIFQDIKLSLKNTSILLRYGLFSSDSYRSGIYAYENDLTYVFYTPNYNNVGSRISFLIGKKFKKNLSIRLKLARWIFENKKEIGNGGDRISGNHKTDLKLQLKLQF